jgi:hypothetical protein
VNQWPLVGRTADLDTIFEWLDHEVPSAVVIAGAAGVGKSRLLREAAGRATERGWAVHSAVGTRAAASIPFGAVASLLAGQLEDATSVEIIAQVRRALTADGDAEGPPLLLVDDAQRLDTGSAALVHQLVADGVCRMVGTVRSGEPAPDAIESLWTADWAARIDLHGLSASRPASCSPPCSEARWTGRHGNASGRPAGGTCSTCVSSSSERRPRDRCTTQEGFGACAARPARHRAWSN